MWNILFYFLFQRRKGGPQIKPSDKFKNNMCFGFCFCLFVCLPVLRAWRLFYLESLITWF